MARASTGFVSGAQAAGVFATGQTPSAVADATKKASVRLSAVADLWCIRVVPVTVVPYNLVKAREAVRKAKLVLRRAEREFDEDCGVGFSRELIASIRAAECRLQEARAELRRIDPTSSE
jgi:hypothetical protein